MEINDSAFIEMMQQITALNEKISALTDKVDDVLIKRLDMLEDKVGELDRFKQRAIGYLVGSGMLGAGLMKFLG